MQEVVLLSIPVNRLEKIIETQVKECLKQWENKSLKPLLQRNNPHQVQVANSQLENQKTTGRKNRKPRITNSNTLENGN